jgi:hypothetical protein
MSDNRINIFQILKNEGKLVKALLYPAISKNDDPYEHTKVEGFLNPIAIDVLFQQISFEALKWKFFGQIPQNSVQIICELKHEHLLKVADKIQIGEQIYKCYKDDSKGFMILKRFDYIVAILETKTE